MGVGLFTLVLLIEIDFAATFHHFKCWCEQATPEIQMC